MGLPPRQLVTVRAAERDVIESHPPLVEAFITNALRELVQAEQRVTESEHDVPERARVLTEHRVGADEAPIPRNALGQVPDCECHVPDLREFRQRSAPVSAL